jgi:hypothetical protein
MALGQILMGPEGNPDEVREIVELLKDVGTFLLRRKQTGKKSAKRSTKRRTRP